MLVPPAQISRDTVTVEESRTPHKRRRSHVLCHPRRDISLGARDVDPQLRVCAAVPGGHEAERHIVASCPRVGVFHHRTLGGLAIAEVPLEGDDLRSLGNGGPHGIEGEGLAGDESLIVSKRSPRAPPGASVWTYTAPERLACVASSGAPIKTVSSPTATLQATESSTRWGGVIFVSRTNA